MFLLNLFMRKVSVNLYSKLSIINLCHKSHTQTLLIVLSLSRELDAKFMTLNASNFRTEKTNPCRGC